MNYSNSPSDTTILHDLASRYAQVSAQEVQQERRELWRRHNSLELTRPLIYMRGGAAWREIPDVVEQRCADPLFRSVERDLRYRLYWASLNDDSIFEPWLAVRPVFSCVGWGVVGERHYSTQAPGSSKIDYPLKTLNADLDKLRIPTHAIDEAATSEKFERISDAIADVLPVVVDRGPHFRMWNGDLSTLLGNLRGIENFMIDVTDNPSGLHRLMGRLSQAVLAVHDQAQDRGHWSTLAHENQAMPYAQELDDPSSDAGPISRGRLWGYQASQEFTLVSPAMHEEFLLQYQLPILNKFGLVAYGCCEDLTQKITMLRQIRNLRRIAVSPMANARKCIEQIGKDYVISWRPSPAEMVCVGFDHQRVRRLTRETLQLARGLHIDITLKDVETVQNDPRRLAEWTRITREIIEETA